MLMPRDVAFDDNGKAIVAGCPAAHYPLSNRKIVWLPSEYPDFIDYDVRGKTLEEIEKECGTY